MADKTVRCCLYCGRDTTAKHCICARCLGNTSPFNNHEGQRGTLGASHECAEDDYSEESGPDSVYRGQHDRWDEKESH